MKHHTLDTGKAWDGKALPASGVIATEPIRVAAIRRGAGGTEYILTDVLTSPVTVTATRTGAAWTVGVLGSATVSGTPVLLPPDFTATLNALLKGDHLRLRVNWRTGCHVVTGGPSGRPALLEGQGVTVEHGSPAAASPARAARTPAQAAPVPAAVVAATPAAPAPIQPQAEAAEAATQPTVQPPTLPAQPGEPSADHRLISSTPPKHAGKVWLPQDAVTAFGMARAATVAGFPSAVMLAGPTGTGKTHAARFFGREEGVDVVVFNCSGIRDPLEWFGHVGAEAGSTYIAESDLIAAASVTNPGRRYVVLDELTRASGFAVNALIPWLEGAGWLTHPLTGNRIDLNPDVQIIATANEGYVHTEPIDEAIWSRFGTWIRLDYLTQEQEQALMLERFPTLPQRDAANLARLGADVRALAATGQCRAVSTRQLHEAAAKMAYSPAASRRVAVVSSLLDAFAPDGASQSERAVVAAKVEAIVWDEPAPNA